MASIGSFGGSRRRTRFRVVAWLAGVGVLLGGFLPGSVKSALHAQGRLHAVAHLLTFLVLGALLNKTSRRGKVRVMLFFAAMLLGFVAEYGEHLVFNMTVEWRDVATNGLGAALGTMLSEFGLRLGKRRARVSLEGNV